MQDPSTAFQGIRPPPGAPQFPPPEQQEQHLKCPRCDSTNTKFCYYNNYNLSQPRHFCKSCRRYWTKGGALRNIPVGGGTRKNSKRGGSGASSSNGGRGGGNNNNNASNSGGGGGISANASSSGATGQQAKRPNTSVSVPPQFTSTGVTHHTMPQQLSYASPVQTLHHLPTLYAAHPADQEHQLLDMGGSFSSLLTSAGHFSSLIDATAFHPVVTCPGGPMTLPVGAHIGGGGSSGLGLLRSGDGHELSDHPQPPPQNPSGTSNVVPGTSAAPENFPGLHGCWDGDGGPDGGVGGGDGTGATGGGWPGLSIYTPSSGFR